MRAAMNAISYLLRIGCPWRYLPGDSFPPRSTVYKFSASSSARALVFSCAGHRLGAHISTRGG
jgi:transposase